MVQPLNIVQGLVAGALVPPGDAGASFILDNKHSPLFWGAPRVKTDLVFLKKLLYCLRYLTLNVFHASPLSPVNRTFSLVYNTLGLLLSHSDA